MNKKIISLGLGVVMAASLAAPALAFEEIVPISAPLADAPTRYTFTITTNGTPLDLARIPAGTGVPLRAVAESDFGSANWFQDENMSYFYFGKQMFTVDYKDNSITLDDAKLEGVTATVVDGVTFVPASVLDKIDGFKVTVDEAAASYTIATKNGEPMMKLARDIQAELDMGMGAAPTEEELELRGISPKNFSQYVSFFPMMINADTIFIGKMADGVKAADVEKELEACRASVQKNFETYLPGPLLMAKNGKVVVNGDYAMLIIGGQYKDADFEDPDFPANPKTTADAIRLFDAYVAAQKVAK